MPLHDDFKKIHVKIRADWDAISDFLDSTGKTAGQFETALENVSSDIWKEFAKIQGRNRFTRALAAVAQSKGFNLAADRITTDAHIDIVMTASVSEEYFIDTVKAGRFWKDSFSASHGEYSHAFQWLAIADAKAKNVLKLSKDASEFYRDIFDAKFRTPEGVWLWSWLCDAFQSANAKLKAGQAPMTSFRSPQTVMEYLFGNPARPGENFLRFYLLRRYIKRDYLSHNLDWLVQLGNSATRGEAFVEMVGAGGDFKISSGDGAMGAKATKAYGKKGTGIWTSEFDRGHKDNDRAFARVDQKASYFNDKGTKTTAIDVTFHKHPGKIYFEPDNPKDVL